MVVLLLTADVSAPATRRPGLQLQRCRVRACTRRGPWAQELRGRPPDEGTSGTRGGNPCSCSDTLCPPILLPTASSSGQALRRSTPSPPHPAPESVVLSAHYAGLLGWEPGVGLGGVAWGRLPLVSEARLPWVQPGPQAHEPLAGWPSASGQPGCLLHAPGRRAQG